MSGIVTIDRQCLNGYVDLFLAVRDNAKDAEHYYCTHTKPDRNNGMPTADMIDEVGPWQHFTDYWVNRREMREIWRLMDAGQRKEYWR